MIHPLPIYVSIAFILIVIVAVIGFYLIIKKSNLQNTKAKANSIFIGFVIWIIIQSVLSLNHIYNTNMQALPPKILLLGVLPTILVIICLLITQSGKQFIDSLPLKNLIFLNILRIPVEIVLWCLFIYKTIPEIMTFEGRNFDILAGITAPIIAYYGFIKAKVSRKLILFWHFLSLALLINVVFIGLLSAPTPFQQFAFTQPNVAILYFPFSLLPTFIVPLILFGHLVSIRQLTVVKK